MPNVLLSGPAGAGKSAAAKEILDAADEPTVIVDFQTIYAALLGIERDPETGRYPERLESEAYVLALTEYIRRAAITGARAMEIDVVLTNSDGAPQRRGELRILLGAEEVTEERVIDPGRAVVEARLADAVDGELSEQCERAVSRWYGRVGR